MPTEAERLEQLITKARQVYQDLNGLLRLAREEETRQETRAKEIVDGYLKGLQEARREALKPVYEQMDAGMVELVVADKIREMIGTAFRMIVREDELNRLDLKVDFDTRAIPGLPEDWVRSQLPAGQSPRSSGSQSSTGRYQSGKTRKSGPKPSGR